MKKNVKKLGQVILLLLISFMFTGCGISQSQISEVSNDNNAFSEYQDLKGVWTGSSYGHGDLPLYGDSTYDENKASYVDRRGDTHVEFIIEGQEDRVFWGVKKVYDKKGKQIREEGFGGAFEKDSNNFYILEHDDGQGFGKIISKDKIEIIYMDNQSDNSFILIYELSLNK